MTTLKRYVIVRDIPGIGGKSNAELGHISVASCSALKQAGNDIVQWQHSYVAGDKTFCIYLATGEDAIRRHAEIGGFPITDIFQVDKVIDPTSANDAPAV